MTTRTAAVILAVLTIATAGAGDGGVNWYSYTDGQVRAGKAAA